MPNPSPQTVMLVSNPATGMVNLWTPTGYRRLQGASAEAFHAALLKAIDAGKERDNAA